VTDTHVPEGVVYYRLQLVYDDGDESYSGVLSFNDAKAPSFTVYPTLVPGNTPVTVTCPRTGAATLVSVIGIDGTVWETGTIPAGATTASVDLHDLARGVYVVVLTNNGNTVAKKILKE
jgi:hypothetical protein